MIFNARLSGDRFDLGLGLEDHFEHRRLDLKPGSVQIELVGSAGKTTNHFFNNSFPWFANSDAPPNQRCGGRRCRSRCEGNPNRRRRTWTENTLRPSFRPITASDAVPRSLSSCRVQYLCGGRSTAGRIPSPIRCRKTSIRVRLSCAASSVSEYMP